MAFGHPLPNLPGDTLPSATSLRADAAMISAVTATRAGPPAFVSGRDRTTETFGSPPMARGRPFGSALTADIWREPADLADVPPRRHQHIERPAIRPLFGATLHSQEKKHASTAVRCPADFAPSSGFFA
jgi:hypothetical protein